MILDRNKHRDTKLIILERLLRGSFFCLGITIFGKKGDMESLKIPIEVSKDILVALNESEKELKNHFQVAIAMMLFYEGKLTLGKAIQMSGITRYEFEKSLAKNKIPISDIDLDQVQSDIKKMKDL